MKDRVPSIRTATLGGLLDKALKASGLSPSEAARRLGWSASRISRLTRGRRGAGVADVAALLGLCEVIGHERGDALQLTADLYAISWCQEHGERVPVDPPALTRCEATAETITSYQTTIVPRLLRTASYQREILRATTALPATEIQRQVTSRVTRQAVLDRERCGFRFFLDERVVDRISAGREVMSEQLHYLLQVCARPNAEIRLVPEAAGLVCALGSFELFEFAQQRPAVYLESLTSTAFLEQATTIAAYRRAVSTVDEIALDETQTRAWLSTRAADLRPLTLA